MNDPMNSMMDVGVNSLVINNGSSSIDAAIRQDLLDGQAAGGWHAFQGITTSVTTVNGQSYTLGYTLRSSGKELVMFTLGGDANLDGTVNFTDFNLMEVNYGKPSGQTWIQGDFTYDGAVNASDYNLLAANFGRSTGGGPPPAARVYRLDLSSVSTDPLVTNPDFAAETVLLCNEYPQFEQLLLQEAQVDPTVENDLRHLLGLAPAQETAAAPLQ